MPGKKIAKTNSYIDDRALESRREDRFRLATLADELAKLVLTQKMPLNIAVYGPWGSGKSSLAKLLEEVLYKESKSIKFVRIDAWKYSKDSFRRQFIMESAKQLKLDVERFRQKLYQKTTCSKLRIPKEEVCNLIKVFLIFLAVIFGLVFLVGIVITLSTGAKDKVFPTLRELLKDSTPNVILSASVFAALFTFVGKLFITDIMQSEVSSEEHFEQVFKDLIKSASKDELGRIIFYIDELDRCAAKDVIEVLESIRTFLEVEKCVFIVSADNRVLELAVQQQMPHPVPEEKNNPYYSSGAEYLDKLFQHQLIIPAILPHRLTSFALSLVKDKPGLWHEANKKGELANLVSVLIPSHVRSPRRVKVLLNGFVSLYEIANARYLEDPTGAPDPSIKMLELAKLSTLRLEFPLFYRDLVQFPRLAVHLTSFLLENKWPKGMDEEAKAYGDKNLVEEYAACKRATNTMLCVKEPQLKDNTSFIDDEDDYDTEKDTFNLVSSEITRRNELLSYLRKTANIHGPSRDVIFLEGAGSPYGILGELADLIEKDAINNDLESLAVRVGKLPEGDRSGVLQLLLETRRQMVGIESKNALSAAVHLINVKLIDPAISADELVSAINLETLNEELPLSWLSPSIKIGFAAQSQEGRILAERALSDKRLFKEENEIVALDAIDAVGDSLSKIMTKIVELLINREPGFIAKVIMENHLSSLQIRKLISETSFLNLLIDRWKEENEGDLDDFSEISKALRSTDELLDWNLAKQLTHIDRKDLVDAWLSSSPTSPKNSECIETLLALIVIASREQWESLEILFNSVPKTNTVMLYKIVKRLFDDIDETSENDNAHESLQRILEHIWGVPDWPNDWNQEEPFDWVIGPDWDEFECRMRKFEFSRKLARLDTHHANFWTRAIARGYEDLLLNDYLNQVDIEAFGVYILEDWPIFNTTDQKIVIEALNESSEIPEDIQRLLLAKISTIDENIEFPFEAEDVPDLINGSEADNEAVHIWFTKKASLEEIREFMKSQDFDNNAYLALPAAAIKRFSYTDATSLITEILESMKPNKVAEVIPRFLENVDSYSFAVWLGEALRSATNEQMRIYYLDIWANWRPKNPDALRILVDAFIHLASSGKGGFELCLKYIDLVSEPPRGTKGRIVDTIKGRASHYNLTKKADKAMIKVGLIKKGLFQKDIELNVEDENKVS